MRKEVVTKTVYISDTGEEFDDEVECLKSEVINDLLDNGASDRYDARDVMYYIFNNLDKLNKIAELENARVVEL